MYYKISEVSQMTDIPIDTIRYYEKRGVLSPMRKGKYRVFSDEDVYLLCEYKKMRSYGLTLQEIRNFHQVASMEDYAGQFQAIRDDCEKKLKYYLALTQSMKSSVDTIRNAVNQVGRYELTEISSKYYIDFFRQKEDGFARQDIWKSWVHEYYPWVEYIAVLDLEDGESENITKNSMWVNAIDEEFVKTLQVPIDESVQRIPAKKALFTVVNRYGERLIDKRFAKEIRKELKKRKLVLDGKMIGKMIARIKEEDQILRYIGIWIPVCEERSGQVRPKLPESSESF